MTKAAAIIGIIAGFLGLIAAATTLLFGGAASAFGTHGADTVVSLGWGGVLFSLATLVAAAMVFARPRGAGGALIVIAVLGSVWGGTLVAICMGLALIAGVVAVVGGREQNRPVVAAPMAQAAGPVARRRKPSQLLLWALGSGALAMGSWALISASNTSTRPATPTSTAAAQPDFVTEMENRPSSDLKPTGQLAAVFEFGGAYTDVQRENAFSEIKDRIVVWELPVYDVKRQGDAYRVATQSHMPTSRGIDPIVGTRLTITPRNDAERQRIESLQTGQMIRIKGQIKGIALRHIDIAPAILWTQQEPPSVAQQVQQEHAADIDIDASAKRYLMDCKRSTVQKAIQLGGMAPDEANQHANTLCAETLEAFRVCLLQTNKGSRTCTDEVNPSSE